jgi:hypothetical protein
MVVLLDAIGVDVASIATVSAAASQARQRGQRAA